MPGISLTQRYQLEFVFFNEPVSESLHSIVVQGLMYFGIFDTDQFLRRTGILSALQIVARAPRSWQSQTLLVFGVAIDIQSASPQEVKLVETTIKRCFVDKPPKRIIGDKTYDSDPIDDRLEQHYGSALIAPHKTNRKKPKTQDGRVLRRYRQRWKAERLFAWQHNFRKIVTRWEYHAENFLGMVQLGCIVILLRYF